jgi:hypothetical protein
MKTSRPFARLGSVLWLVLQGVATVASILLAFAIDAWWDQHKAAEEKKAMLESVKVEMLSDLEWVKPECSFRHAALANTKSLLQATGVGRYYDTKRTLDRRLGDLMFYSPLRFSTGAVNSLLSNGRAAAIENTRLRALLAEFPRRVEEASMLGVRDQANMLDVVAPFFSRNADLLQISNEAYRNGMPPDGAFADPSRVVSVSIVTDHTPLLSNREFAGVVTRTMWVHDRVLLDICDAMASNVDEIIRLIDQELGGTAR